jgi:hypothetical protein
MFIQIRPPNFPVHRINTLDSFYALEMWQWNKLNKHSASFSFSWQLLRLSQFLPYQNSFCLTLSNQRMGIYVVLVGDLIIVRSVELLFSQFQVLRKQSEAKEWIVTVENSALWERRTSTQFWTYLFYIYMWICLCVRMCNTRGSIGCCLKSTTIRSSD